MNDGNVLALDFVENGSVTVGSNNFIYDYTRHFDIQNFSFSIVQGSGSVLVRAYDVDDDDPDDPATTKQNEALHHQVLTPLTDGVSGNSQDVITKIWVNGVALDLTDPSKVTSDGNGGYIILNLVDEDRVTVETNNGFSRLEIENPISVSGDSFDIGNFGYTSLNNGSQISVDVGVSIEDGDGDISSGTIGLVIDPEASSTSIIGGAGDDIIFGGEGKDTLTGNGGDDIFAYSAGDGGATVNLADLITDFTHGEDLIGLTGGLTFGAAEGQASFVDAGTLTGGTSGQTALIINGTSGAAEVLAIIDQPVTNFDVNDTTII